MRVCVCVRGCERERDEKSLRETESVIKIRKIKAGNFERTVFVCLCVCVLKNLVDIGKERKRKIVTEC